MPPSPEPATARPERRIVRRQSLPGPRAIVGGALVLIAMVAAGALANGAAETGTAVVAVAAHDLSAGTVLRPDDVRLQRVRIEGHLRDHALSELPRGRRAVLLGPVAAGEVLQRGNVGAVGTTPYEVSLSVPQARALGGDLRSGETVDVLATPRSAGGDDGHVVGHDVRVLRASQPSTGLGRSGDVTVTFGTSSRSEAEALGSAAGTQDLTLIRTTGAAAASSTSATTTAPAP